MPLKLSARALKNAQNGRRSVKVSMGCLSVNAPCPATHEGQTQLQSHDRTAQR